MNLDQTEAATETLRAAKRRFPSEPAFAAQLAALLKRMERPAEAQEEAAVAELLSRKGNRPRQARGAAANGGEPSANSPPGEGVTDSIAPSVSTGAQRAARHHGGESSTGHNYAIIFDNLRRCLDREDEAGANSDLAAIRDPMSCGQTSI